MELVNLNAHIKSIATKDDSENSPLIIRGFANTVTKDRAGDVIPASAWTTSNALKNYMKNPIMLFGHDHSRPIGKVISLEPTEMGLMIEAEISTADIQIYQLIKDGVLKTFSVGFRIKDADYDDESNTFYITDLELLEISVVSVPCNQDSTFSVAKGMNGADYVELRKQYVHQSNTPVEELTDGQKLFKLLDRLGFIKKD